MIVVWFLLGIGLGVFSAYTQWWTVTRLRRNAPAEAVFLVMGGTLMRWGLAALLLIAGLQQSIADGLAAFVGMMLPRWGMLIVINRRGMNRPPENSQPGE
jgi:hypothetical protein